MSPYWRPPAFAEAIAVVDGVNDWGADGDELVEMMGGDSKYRAQMLVRALLFRTVSDRRAYWRAMDVVERAVGA